LVAPSTAPSGRQGAGIAHPTSNSYIAAIARNGDGTYVTSIVRPLTSGDGKICFYGPGFGNWALGGSFAMYFSGTFETA
jgi:hypothetical protein